MTDDDQLTQLRGLPALAGLGDEALARIARASTELTCTVVVEAPGRTIELGTGEIFGELSLLVPESTRSARVRATTPVRCLAIDRGAFEELLDEEPEFARAMLDVVARRLWDVMRGQDATTR